MQRNLFIEICIKLKKWMVTTNWSITGKSYLSRLKVINSPYHQVTLWWALLIFKCSVRRFEHFERFQLRDIVSKRSNEGFGVICPKTLYQGIIQRERGQVFSRLQKKYFVQKIRISMALFLSWLQKPKDIYVICTKNCFQFFIWEDRRVESLYM